MSTAPPFPTRPTISRKSVKTLFVTGKAQKEDENGRYLHRGIARRAFERRFSLADHIKVTGASLNNGLLHVDLVREVPEAMKPRQIPIGGGTSAKVIEGKMGKAA